MGSFLNIDTPVYKIMTRIGNWILLSVLWMVGCIPIVTIGASTAALYHSIHKEQELEDRSLAGEFVHAFRTGFRQSTGSFLILGVLELLLIGEGFLTEYLQEQGELAGKMWLLFTVLKYCNLVWMVYAAAYAARFEDTVKRTLLNAGIIALTKIGRSLVLLAAMYAAVWFLPISPPLALLLPGALGSLAHKLIEPVFEGLLQREQPEEPLAQ